MKFNQGIALSAVIYSVAGGAVTLLAGIALAFATSTSTTVNNLSERVNMNTSNIAQQHLSACVQNENARNFAIALKTNFVSDPSCNK